jgi:glycosyltransferase involved in cell wall biosynthesis
LRIGIYSNGPDTPTGYGVQTAQLAKRLRRDGHEVHIFANYGQIAGVREWEGCAVWPQGVAQYGLDVVDQQAEMANVEVIITLYDTWVLKQAWGDDKRVISWAPIDHYPAPPEVAAWCREHETIAMSEYGAKALKESGIDVVATIPHAIEDVFSPGPTTARDRMKVPEDAFLVGINAANIGITPPRKNWGGNLEAVARLMRQHEDVYLYLHTDLARAGGLPIPVIISALGIPKERIVVVPPTLYRGSLIGTEELAGLYRSMDVLLATAKGEGFGVPVIEAMGVGTPSIVSDFAASPELVGDVGWKVPGQLDWDHNQGAWFTTPFTALIVQALEEAYAEAFTKEAQERRSANVARAERYRADHVYETQWRPFIASLTEPVKPKRKGKSNAAKRRAKKARKSA